MQIHTDIHILSLLMSLNVFQFVHECLFAFLTGARREREGGVNYALNIQMLSP